LAIATSFDHNKLHQNSTITQGLSNIPKLAYNLAKAKTLSESIENGEKYIAKHNLVSDLHDLELAITNYENDLGKTTEDGTATLTIMP
jgi:hypothetical protein